MFCPNCGKELPEGTAFCTGCGANIAAYSVNTPAPAAAEPVPEAIPTGPVFTGFDVLKKTFSSAIFLVMCILISVVAGCSIADGGFDLFAVLGTIACWIIYANAKSETEPLKQGGYKFASVITRIIYVVGWVAVGLLGFFTVASAVVLSVFGTHGEEIAAQLDGVFSELPAEIVDGLSELVAEFDLGGADAAGIFWAGIFIGMAVLFVLGLVLLIVLNICYMRPIDKYTHSLSDGFVTGTVNVYNKSLANKFLGFGIFFGIVSLDVIFGNLSSAPFMAIGSAAEVAFPILAYVLIKNAKPEN